MPWTKTAPKSSPELIESKHLTMYSTDVVRTLPHLIRNKKVQIIHFLFHVYFYLNPPPSFPSSIRTRSLVIETTHLESVGSREGLSRSLPLRIRICVPCVIHFRTRHEREREREGEGKRQPKRPTDGDSREDSRTSRLFYHILTLYIYLFKTSLL